MSGRTYDVVALTGQRPSGDALLSGEFLDSGGLGCTGIIKLAQWFVAELLTPEGSVAYAPDRGTGLFDRLATGSLRTEADVFAAFGFAVGQVQAIAAAVETTTMPADERFADAVLLGVEIHPGFLSLSVALTSRAGSSREIIMPIPTVPAS